MGRPPQRVYVHVGLHKTGTTYLQNLMRVNRQSLRRHGIYYPGGSADVSQQAARMDLFKRQARGYVDPRVPGAWDRLVEAVNTSGATTAIISDEALSASSERKIKQIVTAFEGSEVHCVVTLRDLGRVVVSDWQEVIKNDETVTWQRFVAELKDPNRIGINPARGFWRRHDAVRVVDAWSRVVPAHRIHVVTVPPSGSSPDLLLRRFSSVVGIDPAILTEQPAWVNETLTAAETEVLRRVNERMGGRLNQRAYERTVKASLVPKMAERPNRQRFALPAEEIPWFANRSAEIAARLEDRGLDIVGDLHDLRVSSTPDLPGPDETNDVELLDAAVDGLAMVLEELATARWARIRRHIENRYLPGGPSARVAMVITSRRRAVSRLIGRSRTMSAVVSAIHGRVRGPSSWRGRDERVGDVDELG